MIARERSLAPPALRRAAAERDLSSYLDGHLRPRFLSELHDLVPPSFVCHLLPLRSASYSLFLSHPLTLSPSRSGILKGLLPETGAFARRRLNRVLRPCCDRKASPQSACRYRDLFRHQLPGYARSNTAAAAFSSR